MQPALPSAKSLLCGHFKRQLFPEPARKDLDRKCTRLNSSHTVISYAVFCLKKKNINQVLTHLNPLDALTMCLDVQPDNYHYIRVYTLARLPPYYDTFDSSFTWTLLTSENAAFFV